MVIGERSAIVNESVTSAQNVALTDPMLLFVLTWATIAAPSGVAVDAGTGVEVADGFTVAVHVAVEVVLRTVALVHAETRAPAHTATGTTRSQVRRITGP